MSSGQPLILVAASGLAREVLGLVRAQGTYDVVGLLDDSVELHGTRVGGVPVLGGMEVAALHPTSRFVVCAGRGTARALLVERLAALGVLPDRYATVRHASVEVPAGCEIGEGTVLLAHATLTADVRLGRHVVVMPGVTLTHDDVVDDFATLCAGVSLGGSVMVGERAYLGMNAAVRERCRVGADATLGMGAALLCDLPAGETWLGVPARPRDRQGPSDAADASTVGSGVSP